MRLGLSWLLLCLATTVLNAQPHPKTIERSDSVAAAMCQCMDTALVGIDPEIKELVELALRNPENGQQEIQNYMLLAGEMRAAEIVLQLQKFGAIDSELTACFNAATLTFQNLQADIAGLPAADQLFITLDFETEEKIISLLVDSMSRRGGCEFAYQFIALGLQLKNK
jgi:hypothetical protein